MIISHRHNFVFLRSCKTGSTSTALAIRKSGILDPQCDISNLIEGRVGDPNLRPLNMPTSAPPDSKFAEVAPHTLVWLNPAKRAMHLNLPELVGLGLLSAEDAENYIVYVGIREPLDKMISAANFLLRRAPDLLFQQHKLVRPRSVQEIFDNRVIDTVMPILAMPQSHWFQTDNPQNMRFLIFEDLPDEVSALITQYGGTWSAHRMPERKTGLRNKRVHTAENLLRPETVDEIRQTYQQDFVLWQAATEGRSPHTVLSGR